MTNGEAVNWLINISADIGKAEHRDLWHYEQALYEIREMLESAQPEQWIPCSDENPKADGRYLITGKMGTVYSLDFEDGRWYGGIKPVAWMLLPKPYAERREE